MISLEEQLRRYAVDVAGPALAEPPADLVAVGRPRHRGRWVLVAALAVFICGLTWVATRPADSTAPPVVTEPEPTTTVSSLPVPAQVTSWIAGRGTTCRASQPALEPSTASVSFAGPDGHGLCVDFSIVETPAYGYSSPGPDLPDQALLNDLLDAVPRVDVRQLVAFVDGADSTYAMISACHAGWVQAHPLGNIHGGIAFATASPSAEFVRFDTADGPIYAQAADIPGLDGVRVVMVRIDALADQGLVEPVMTALDAELQPLEPATTTTLLPGCNPVDTALDSPALVDDGINDSHPFPGS